MLICEFANDANDLRYSQICVIRIDLRNLYFIEKTAPTT